jgi:hypothetical protein
MWPTNTNDNAGKGRMWLSIAQVRSARVGGWCTGYARGG